MAAGKLSHECNIRHIAGEVGGVGTHHCLGLRPQQPLKVSVVQLSVPVRPDKVHRRPLSPQTIEGTQHGVMLTVRGDHMVSRPQGAGNGDVQRCRRVGRECHPFRLSAEQRSRLAADAIHRPCGGQGLRVGAPPAVAACVQGRQDRLCHAGGLGPGRSRLVQVDHGRTTFPAPASFSAMAYILVTEPTASFSVRP